MAACVHAASARSLTPLVLPPGHPARRRGGWDIEHTNNWGGIGAAAERAWRQQGHWYRTVLCGSCRLWKLKLLSAAAMCTVISVERDGVCGAGTRATARRVLREATKQPRRRLLEAHEHWTGPTRDGANDIHSARIADDRRHSGVPSVGLTPSGRAEKCDKQEERGGADERERGARRL